MRVLSLNEGLLVTEAGIRPCADTDCNEVRATATGQRTVSMFAFLLLEDSEGKHF